MATCAPGSVSAMAACAASRKPSSSGVSGASVRASATIGGKPIPPATSTGVAPGGGGRKPWPSGPVTQTASPFFSAHRRCVPGPTSSSMNHSCPSLAPIAENARGRNGRSSSPAPQPFSAASM